MVQINTNDLRDIKGDAVDKVKSFAVLLGDQKARLLGVAFIVLGTYFGWSLFAHPTLIAYSIFLILRTYFYQKEADIYWQTPISLQGVLAYGILYPPQ